MKLFLIKNEEDKGVTLSFSTTGEIIEVSFYKDGDCVVARSKQESEPDVKIVAKGSQDIANVATFLWEFADDCH